MAAAIQHRRQSQGTVRGECVPPVFTITGHNGIVGRHALPLTDLKPLARTYLSCITSNNSTKTVAMRYDYYRPRLMPRTGSCVENSFVSSIPSMTLALL